MSASAAIIRHLRRQLGASASDADLLRAYGDRRDEDAFRALVERHGPMILGVCRRRLGDIHAADDAFQATFLALARNIRSVRRPEALDTWLYKVAMRVCGRVRAAAVRCRELERQSVPRPLAGPSAELTARELLNVLDEELIRLPERYRRAIWLVYWQGLPHAEAAARLNVSSGALHGRLDRGRKHLADRLRRRGFGPDAAARALLLAGAGAVAVPGDLLAHTVALAAAPWSTALPAAIVVLAASAVPSNVIPATAVVLFVLGAGMIGLVASRGRERPETETPQPPVAHAPDSADEPPAAQSPPRRDLHGDPLPPGALARLGTLRLRHPFAGPVVVLPDGRSVASIGQMVKVWDLATGKLLREFGPLAPLISSYAHPAISPDRRWLAIAGADALQVWDMTIGRLVYSTASNGHTTPVYAYSPDGKLLASGGEDSKVRVRDAETGQLLRTSDSLRAALTHLVFAGQDTLVTGGHDHMLKTWDVATATVRRQFRSGHVGIAALAATGDGKWLASAGQDDRKVRLWDLLAEREVAVFDVPFQSSPTVSFSPDGTTLAAAGSGGPVQLWDIVTRRSRILPLGRALPGSRWSGGLKSLTFSADGQLILGTDWGHVLHCLNVTTGRDHFASDERAGPVRGVSFTADSKAVRSGCMDAFVRTYDLTGCLLKRQPAGHTIFFAPDGRVGITWWDDEWWLMDPDTGRMWGRTKVARQGVLAAAFAPNGRTVAVASTPPGQPPGRPRLVLDLFDAATGKLARTQGDVRYGEVLKFTPDGRTLAMVERHFADNRAPSDSVHLWDAVTGRTIRDWPIPPGFVSRDFDFSPDSRLLAIPRLEREPGGPPFLSAALVAVVEVASGRQRMRLRLELDAGEVWSIRFAPDGRDLILGLHDGTVRIWDLTSGRERHRFAGNSGSVTSLDISPNGRLIASGTGDHLRSQGGGNGDGTVLLWPFPPAPEPATVALPSDRLARDALWADLGSSDAVGAGEVLNRLVADPAGSVALIKERLVPIAITDPAQIERWVADLDVPRFAARTRAAAELERLGDRAEPALRKALAGTPSAEVKQQAERLVAKLNGPIEQPDILRSIRAVEALEHIATPEARQLLERLAGGDPVARLTRDARASLDRLGRRR
jgi:RNA polymerase sigma factor (sigma-70 family)